MRGRRMPSRAPTLVAYLWTTQERGCTSCGRLRRVFEEILARPAWMRALYGGRGRQIGRQDGADLIAFRLTGTLMRPSSRSGSTSGRFHVEAHVPAQQSSSGAHPWLPCPYAHPRRPRHPRGAPWQGSPASVGLSPERREPPCCRRATASPVARRSPRPFVMVDAPVAAGSSCTYSIHPRMRTFLPGLPLP